MRGADLLVKALTDAGATKIFALSGNQIMSIFDASIGTGLQLIHTRHEAAAVGHRAALVDPRTGFGHAFAALIGGDQAAYLVRVASAARPPVPEQNSEIGAVDDTVAVKVTDEVDFVRTHIDPPTDDARITVDVSLLRE